MMSLSFFAHSLAAGCGHVHAHSGAKDTKAVGIHRLKHRTEPVSGAEPARTEVS